MKSNNTMGILWAKQFTKRILILTFIGWCVGGVYGMVYEIARLIMSPEMANIDGLLVYFAVPLTCGLPSYIIPNLFVKKKQVECGMNPDVYTSEIINSTNSPNEETVE